jgi:hypothetical protein
MKKNKECSKMRFKALNNIKIYFTIQLILIGFVLLLTARGAIAGNIFKTAGKLTGTNYKILVSIAYVESGLNPYALDINGNAVYPESKQEAIYIARYYIKKNYSVDIGLMQVNYNFWGKRLNLSIGNLLTSKINILAGAFILKHYQADGIWQGVQNYHNGGGFRYKEKVKKIYGILKKNYNH